MAQEAMKRSKKARILHCSEQEHFCSLSHDVMNYYIYYYIPLISNF
jgi:hypothetical protein